MAITLNQEAVKLGCETDVFPGISGELMLVVYHKQHDLEFTIETDNRITFVHEIDSERVLCEGVLPFEGAKTKIRNLTEIPSSEK